MNFCDIANFTSQKTFNNSVTLMPAIQLSFGINHNNSYLTIQWLLVSAKENNSTIRFFDNFNNSTFRFFDNF